MVPRLWKSLWGLPSSLPTWFPCPHPQVSASKLQPLSGLAPDVSSTLGTSGPFSFTWNPVLLLGAPMLPDKFSVRKGKN